MEELLTKFAHYLRGNEIDVSTASLEDAILLLPYMKITNRFDFQTSLQQIFVKHVENIERYQLCFQEFFFEQIGDIIHQIEKKEAQDKLNTLSSEFMQKQQEKEKKRNDKFQKIVKGDDGKKDNEEEWEDFIHEVSFLNQEEFNKANALHEITKEKGKGITNQHIQTLNTMKPKDVQQYIEELLWKAIEKGNTSVVFDAISQLQKDLNLLRNDIMKYKNTEKALLNAVEKDVQKGMRKMVHTTIDNLKERPLNKISSKELEELREHIRQHSKGLMTRFSKLLKQTNFENELDMQKVIQHSARTYGVPIELFYVKPKKNRTKIDLILDVSGSVVKSAELLLMFMYLIYKRFPNQVRVFTFVGLLSEVTDMMKTDDWEEMLDSCLKKAPIDYRGYSDYDRAFGIYENEYMNDVSKDTIVLLVGDARNNRNDARVPTFKRIQDLSKAVYWLNPEDKEKWNHGDSVIGKYQTYANGVLETVNTKQLLQNLEYVSSELFQS